MEEKVQDINISERYNPDNFIGEDIEDDTYDRQPVESFGKSLLESMVFLLFQGWSEERGVGKSTQYAMKNFITPSPRAPRQGLGADPKPLFRNKREKELYEKNQKANQLKQGKLIEKDSRVKLISGKHKGLNGLVVSVFIQFQCNEQAKEFYIQLDINEQIVKSYHHELQLEDKNRSVSRSRSKSPTKKINPQLSSKQLQNDYENSKKSTNPQDSMPPQKKIRKSWIQQNLRVRIINKKSRHYNSKVILHDIIDSMTFSNLIQLGLITEDGEMIENLREKDLETVIPAIGKRVKFVLGDYKDCIGVIQSRDKKKGTAVILLEESYEVVEATLEKISDFVEEC